MDVTTYESGGGLEHFLSFEDTAQDLLVGFCRLRFPSYSHAAPGAGPAADGDAVRRELEDAALVRELHVYGSPATFDGEEDGGSDGDWQHRGYGRRLLREAEDLAADAGFPKLSVISGIGVRGYYRDKLGYHQDGPYVSRRL